MKTTNLTIEQINGIAIIPTEEKEYYNFKNSREKAQFFKDNKDAIDKGNYAELPLYIAIDTKDGYCLNKPINYNQIITLIQMYL